MTALIHADRAPGHIAMGCDWCGGSGTWTDENGERWPCIKCRHGKTGEDNRLVAKTTFCLFCGSQAGSGHKPWCPSNDDITYREEGE